MSSEIVVLDASAVLALLQNEAGAEKLTLKLLASSTISTVNVAEVHTRLVRGGGSIGSAWEDALAPLSHIAPFTLEQAKIAGDLVLKTRTRGLSLGDRACLALAISLNAPVYTSEQVWKGLDVGVPIHLIR